MGPTWVTTTTVCRACRPTLGRATRNVALPSEVFIGIPVLYHLEIQPVPYAETPLAQRGHELYLRACRLRDRLGGGTGAQARARIDRSELLLRQQGSCVLCVLRPLRIQRRVFAIVAINTIVRKVREPVAHVN